MLDRLLTWYTKLFALWVVLCGILAYAFPAPFLAIKPAMSGFFALTMFGIGAVLTVEDFRNIAQRPAVVALGMAAQFTLMPIGAFLAAWLFDLPRAYAVGFILTGSAPGAMASNVISYIARADTAYSVSLTTVSTLACPVLTPALVYLLARSYLPVSYGEIFVDLLLTVVLPLLAGLGLKLRFPKPMARAERIFPAISVTFIVFICCVVIAGARASLPLDALWLVGIALLLNIYGMTAGFGVGRLFGLLPKRQRTLAIEIGMQNAGLGTVLALKHFEPATAIPTAMFVFVCILTAAILVELWKAYPPDDPGGGDPIDARPGANGAT